MIVFGPAKPKHTITVFTDIDCPWCQRLHTARWPSTTSRAFACATCSIRATGPDTESGHKAETVWC